MINKKEIRFILPAHAWTSKYMKANGYDVSDPYTGNNVFFRLIRELFFRFHFPFLQIWFNKNNITTKPILFVYEALIIPEYIEWLHKKNPSSRIILYYENPVNVSVNPNKISSSFCEKWTSDIKDAKKFNMNYYYGGGYNSQWKVKKENPVIDIFYVGKDKGRLKYILKLKKEFKRIGLIAYFHIVAPRSYMKKFNSCYKAFMPYSEVLTYLGKTKAILHLKDGCQSGITIRIQESLLHEIKLITDDKDIVSYDFYNPKNIFIIGIDDIESLPSFLKIPFQRPNSLFYKRPFYADMIKNIVYTEIGDNFQ